MIRYSITLSKYCHIDMYRRSLLSMCAFYVCTCLCVCACVRTCVCVCMYNIMSTYIHTQVSLSVLKCVKIHRRSDIFDKNLSLAIFDELLVRQINQGLPKILLQK